MTPTRQTVHAVLLGLLVAVTAGITLTACGGSGKRSTTRSSSTTASGSTTASSSTTAGTPTTATTATTASTAAPAPLTSAVWTLPDAHAERVQVSVYDLRRDGPYLVLDFGLRCLTAGGCDTESMLATNNYEDTSMTDFERQNSSASGIVLVDPAAAEVYRAAENADGYAFTSAFTGDELAPGRTFLGWARYRLPPASVTSLDVGFPSGGPVFGQVSIGDGPAPAPGAGTVAAESQTAATFNPDSTRGMRRPVGHLILTSGSDSRYTSSTATRSSIALRGDVLFHFDKASLTAVARGTLASVAQQISHRARGTIEVTGYTDDIGTPAFNLGLSRRRAASVVTALRRLTPGARYTTAGEGEADPVATNATASGRALNRRVTVAFSVKRPPTPARTTTQPASTRVTGSLHFVSAASHRYRLSIASAQREGQLLLVELDVTCTGHARCSPGGDLGAGTNTIPPEPAWEALDSRRSGFIFGGLPEYDSVNGFTLLDPATGEAYLAARAGLVPLTGTFAATTHPAVGRTTRIWAYFPAPPSSTARLQLVSPLATGYFHVHAAGRPQVLLTAN